MHRLPLSELKKIKEEMDQISPSFCLAKWLQVTIHLQTGQTHSCHHPPTHKINVEELKDNPSALHNTHYKKQAREEMLKGKRPKECEYCWKIEDAKAENLSDRTYKSSEDWSYQYKDKISKLPWDADINPTYLEVSFGNECNFRCAYCAPNVSSSILNEINRHGTYSVQPYFSVDALKKADIYPFNVDENNPYVEAFWKWWPNLQKSLKVFRITGGEPLLNSNTFKILNEIIKNPLPDLELAINSNLGVPETTYKKFLDLIKIITERKLVKKFTLYTSVDTYGKNAEFVRFGLDYPVLLKNVRTFLECTKNCEVVFMCTYNAFSVINFNLLLKDFTELKLFYRNEVNEPRVLIDIPYLNSPEFLSCKILDKSFSNFMKADIDYMKCTSFSSTGDIIYYPTEIEKLQRIYYWFKTLDPNKETAKLRKDFASFVREYSERKRVDLAAYVPEYLPFIKECILESERDQDS